MDTQIEVDASELSRLTPRTHPLWWGILGAVLIEIAVVANLLTSYFYLMTQNETWPPEGTDPPDLLWATVVLVLLPISSLTMYWAGKGSDRGHKTQLALGVTLSCVLATIALAARGMQMHAFDLLWSDHAYGSILWVVTGFHFTHVVSAIVGTAVVAVMAWMNYFTPDRQLGVVVDTLYWYFVAGMFVPIYLVLYIAPRIL